MSNEEIKHTPGRWRVEEGTTVIWSHNAYDPGTNSVGCIVARAAQPSSWKGSRPTADEQEANARLIAAAPDLLAALERAQKTIEREFPNGQLIIDIRAAIHLAKHGQDGE